MEEFQIWMEGFVCRLYDSLAFVFRSEGVVLGGDCQKLYPAEAAVHRVPGFRTQGQQLSLECSRIYDQSEGFEVGRQWFCF